MGNVRSHDFPDKKANAQMKKGRFFFTGRVAFNCDWKLLMLNFLYYGPFNQ